MQQKVTTYLWFDGTAEEAVTQYVALIPDSRIVQVNRFGDSRPGPKGAAFTVVFELGGQRFIALNGGPHHKFTPAISLFVSCETQEEVDRYWEGLLAGGGSPTRCGWLVDRFGLSWQIIPKALMELMSDPDPARAGRVMQAMMGMVKIDIAGLRRAHAGE